MNNDKITGHINKVTKIADRLFYSIYKYIVCKRAKTRQDGQRQVVQRSVAELKDTIRRIQVNE